MVRTRIVRGLVEELKEKIQLAEKAKREYTEYLQKLEEKYARNEISYSDYVETLYQHRDGRTIKEWIEYFDQYIHECKKRIKGQKREVIKKNLTLILFSSILILILVASSIYLRPTLTGLFVQEPGIIPEEIAPEILIVDATVETTQYGAVLGQPVKWKKVVELEEQGTAKIKLPEYATDISVNKILSEEKWAEALQNQTSPYQDQEEPLPSSEVEESKEKQAKFSITGAVIGEGREPLMLKFFRNIRGAITGRVIEEPLQELEIEIDDTATEYEVEYETPAPYAIEEELERGKRIKLVGPETIHYENVLAFTELDESLNIKNPSSVKIKWVEDNSYVPVQNIKDRDNNEIYDYIEWIAPVLSEQTFEIEIIIIDAEHLDSNRNLIVNIYDYVNETDGITYTIPENQYARAYFERDLSSGNVIDIYVTNIQTATIEVYEKDSDIIIGNIDISDEGKYYISLSHTGTQSVFDMKSIGTSVIYDYIHDAPQTTQVWPTSVDTEAPDGGTACVLGNIQADDELACAQVNMDGGETGYMNITHTIDIEDGADIGDVWACIRFFLSSKTDDAVDGPLLIDVGHIDGGLTWNNYLTIKPPDADPYQVENTHCYNVTDFITDETKAEHVKINITYTEGDENQKGMTVDFSYVNITYEVAVDDNIPQFTPPTEYPTNDTPFSNQGTNYKINSTIEFTNGTAGIEMNGATNYSATNVTNAFTVAITNLSAGIYDYFWWGFGNGSSTLYNKTDTKTYSVAKSTDTCGVYFNESSPQTFPKIFIVWTNCSSPYTLYRNGTEIDNNTEQGFEATAYNFSVMRTDAENYTDYYYEQEFQITPAAGVVSLFLNGNADNHTVDFKTNSNVSAFTNNGAAAIYQNGSTITDNNDLNITRAANYYNITAVLAAGGNYTYGTKTYWLTVTKSSDICGVEFNETSGLEYPGTFLAWSNCSSANYLMKNGTIITNDTEQTLAASAYNFSTNRTDTANYSDIYDEQEFRITPTTGQVSLFLNGNADNHAVKYPVEANVSALTNYGTVALYQNGTTITDNNNLNITRAVNYYNMTAVSTGDQNHSTATITYWLTVTQGTPTGSLDNNETSWEVFYPTDVNVSYSGSGTGDGDLGYEIFENGTSVGGTKSGVRAGATAYEYIFNTTAGVNWSASANIETQTLLTNKSLDSCSVYFNESSPQTFPKTFIVWTNCSSPYDLYRNETPIDNNTEQGFEAGAYNFSVMRTDAANYTNYYHEQEFQIDKSSDVCGVEFNVSSPLEYPGAFRVWSNCSTANYLRKNETIIANYSNHSLAVGAYNFSTNRTDTANYSDIYGEREFRITPVSEVSPEIYNVTGLGAITLTDGPGATYLIINFSVSDGNGAENLVNTSAALNITKDEEELRINSTCAVKDFEGNYANYSCNITMWWWDAAGDWTVYANITDQQSNLAINDTHTRSVGALKGFEVSPAELSFDSLLAGSTNQTPSDYFTLNNTGNVDIVDTKLEVNATDLIGETNAGQALWAGNFSFNDLTGGDIECNVSGATEATAMVNFSYTAIYGATLAAGNFTKNDGTAQENLYLCLREVGLELDEQQYSTDAFDYWTIRVLLVAVIPARRRKKKKKKEIKDDKLTTALDIMIKEMREMKFIMKEMGEKEKVSKKEIIEILELRQKETVPATIFTKELGGLEALCKYMKENLKMSYHEIAKELLRDDRTIWTSYNKAMEKQKEPIEVKETNIYIPISIFRNRNLTVLESIIIHLKLRGIKYNEIAKLLDRDQRNIQTIYSRAMKKLKK